MSQSDPKLKPRNTSRKVDWTLGERRLSPYIYPYFKIPYDVSLIIWPSSVP